MQDITVFLKFVSIYNEVILMVSVQLVKHITDKVLSDDFSQTFMELHLSPNMNFYLSVPTHFVSLL